MRENVCSFAQAFWTTTNLPQGLIHNPETLTYQPFTDTYVLLLLYVEASSERKWFYQLLIDHFQSQHLIRVFQLFFTGDMLVVYMSIQPLPLMMVHLNQLCFRGDLTSYPNPTWASVNGATFYLYHRFIFGLYYCSVLLIYICECKLC